MINLTVANVNEALPVLLNVYFRNPSGVIETKPRGVRTLELEDPVCTTFTRPWQRVLFEPRRNANPFFHFFESMWILAGHEDVQFLEYLLPRMREYSDEGVVFHAAYGARLMWQVPNVIHELRCDPQSRRAVASIFDPHKDNGYTGRDMPCNLVLVFRLRDGALNLTVFNRSNDLIWGAYGTNSVQFSFIQEYVAAHLGARLGSLRLITTCMHLYPDVAPAPALLQGGLLYDCDYDYSVAQLLYPGESIEAWDSDLRAFFATWHAHLPGLFSTFWWATVAEPLWRSFLAYKQRDFESAIHWARQCKSTDWATGAEQWLLRRAVN